MDPATAQPKTALDPREGGRGVLVRDPVVIFSVGDLSSGPEEAGQPLPGEAWGPEEDTPTH
jgi:hypothetical protein